MDTLTPLPGLPDMVFAANGAFSVDGIVYGARFRFPQRSAEAAAHREYYEADPATWKFVSPQQTNEGEGDFAYLPAMHGGLVLAGYGFRTEHAAHAEVQAVLGRPVVSLRLVDPRFYHLDVALARDRRREHRLLPGRLLGRFAASAAASCSRTRCWPTRMTPSRSG